MKKLLLITAILISGMGLKVDAQVKVCMSYEDFKANKFKPYTDLTPGKEPDTCRVKYDGQQFVIKTDDKEVNSIIKKEVFLMSIDNQLFVNQRTLRDENGNILPILVKKGLISDYHHKK